ncbi:hypothetical protein NMG60_11022681 [Bertholletia excelsa]
MKIFNWVHRKLHHKGKKADPVANEAQTQVLLTIGTFGFDPLNEIMPKNKCPVNERSEECGEEEEYVVDYELEDYGSDSNKWDEEHPLMRAALGFGCIFGNEDEDEKQNEKRERITLADLFSADSEEYTKADQSKVKDDLTKMPDDFHGKKRGSLFGKKLNSPVGDDKRPIKKLHQLMRRMLRRKIHPDIGGKLLNEEAQMETTSLLHEENGAIESICLL